MTFQPPERFNIADYFLDDRIAEGRGDRTALRIGDATRTYAEVQAAANRAGCLARDPEEPMLCYPQHRLRGRVKRSAFVTTPGPGIVVRCRGEESPNSYSGSSWDPRAR